MSKKNKKGAYQPKSPIKVLLPVLIGLAVVALTCVIIAIASKPVESAKVENPNETYLQIGNHKITKQQVYESLRASGGISTFTFLMDKDLLSDINPTDEEIQAAKDKAIYGTELLAQMEELEELKAEVEKEADEAKKNKLQAKVDKLDKDIKEAKEEAEFKYNFNFETLGYVTPESQKEYFKVLAQREIYAKKAYKEYIDSNDFTKDQYIAASKGEDTAKYENASHVIAIVFQNDAQAKAYLKALSNPVDSTDLANGWKFLNDKEEKAILNTEIKELEASIKKYNEEIAKETDETKKAELQTKLELATSDKAAKEEEVKTLKDPVAMADWEVALAFIELYNYAYAYYQGGNVSEYFNKDETTGAYTTLKDDKKLLKEGTHYEIKTETVTNDETTTEVKTVVFNKENLDKLAEENEFCKFVYNDTTAKATFSSAVYDTLVANADKEEGKTSKNYTYSPTKTTTSLYYLAYKFGSYKAPETSKYEDVLKAIETLEKEIAAATDATVKAEKEASLKENKDYVQSLKNQLIEENYNDNQQTRMLVELRQANGLVIYDRFLNASYKAAYEYLYETTLKIDEAKYPEYKSDGKKHNKLAFTYNNKAGEKQDYTAEKFYGELLSLYSAQVSQQFIVTYALLSNENFNKIYNPYTKEIHDRDNYKALINADYNNIYMELLSGKITSVQAYKYAFELGVFATYGFDASYGWKSFLRDYLLLADEKALVGYLSTSYAADELQMSKIKYEDVLAEMQEIYDAYYSVKGVNLVVSVDYNNDSTPDTFELDGPQTYWTEYQMGLVQELTDELYKYAENDASESAKTLEAKLTEAADEYKEATFEDPKWGKFVAAGLKAKVEKAADYKNTDSLVQEFHDELAKIYLEIEKAEGYTLGAWTEDEKTKGFAKKEVFATQYGYHRVTVINALERVYVNKDKGLDLKTLTIEMYKKYLEDTKAYDDTVTKAITTYLDPAMNAVYTENEASIFQLELCEQLIKNQQIEFKDSSILTKYTKYEANYRAYIEKIIADEAEAE